ncbi:MAG: helix-turn-helix domain-containing protein [Bacteroides sp.]|uniref:helix-turn-helix domain-containing protein n=1 Tax=Bacteroides sp. TaxID=29523 RepID=UPI0026DF1F07|nr:helix-turn-helix domain-containing protein [Bacteroides sp.]MDO5421363.1 helix-turn-helix domain-containing protein [Bacteroides sp.]
MMNRCRNFMEIVPERLYSVSEAARLLGVHRCTIYTYISLPERPLPFVRQTQSDRLSFQGAELIAFKSAGLPKKGRKRK